jgi:hypothetical protein
MTTVTKTGYERDTTGLWISKDVEARLTYTFDWTDWLPTGDTVSAVTYTLQVRANDPDPLIRHSSGITGASKKTYVELGGGAIGKVYTITCQVTTADGLIDRRAFRVKVENRSA